MKLITEINYDPLSLITEADASGEKHLYIKGPMAVSEVKNKNGRVYKKALLEKVIEKYTNDYIKTGRALGELNHPSRLSVDYERATHLVTEMVQDNNVWIGKARVLKTPMGQIIEGLLRSGVNIGMSTRGAGSIVEANNTKYVGDDFVMTAIDAVSDPSGQFATKDGSMAGCFVNGVMEGVEFIQTPDGRWLEQEIAEMAKAEYDKKTLNEAKALELFSAFMAGLKTGRLD
jgi:hypothetical protein